MSAAKSSRPSVWRTFPSLLTANERRGLGALFALMLVAMVLETVGAGLVLPTLSLLGGPAAGPPTRTARLIGQLTNGASRERVIAGGMIILALVFLVKNAVLALLTWRQARFSHDLNAEVSQRLFTLYLSQPYTFHLQRNSANLVNNIMSEVLTFTSDVVAPALTIVAESLVLFALAVLLFIVEPVGAIAVTAFVTVASWSFYRLARGHAEVLGVSRQFHEDRATVHLHQGLGAAKEVILLGRAPEFLARFNLHSTQRALAAQRHDTLKQLPRLVLEVLAVLALAVLTIAMLARGRPASEILPVIGLFAAVGFRIIPSANRILFGLQSMRYARPALDRLHEEFSTLPPALEARSSERHQIESGIVFESVSFTYPGSVSTTLDRVSHAIARGETIGIVGASGAGKSTFIDVLLGLLTPTSGRVLVDGHDIQGSLRQWQDQIGYVPQVIYLTDDTLRRNVAFGLADEDIDEEAVKRAVRGAHLEEFVAALPEGLESVVGERGVRISGGERQRVGIARALYHDPDVLVLDEATSALDTDTEREIMSTVRELKRRKTVVVVSHRLSTIDECDRVYRLASGRLESIDHAAPALTHSAP